MLAGHTGRERISLAEFVSRDVQLTLSKGEREVASARGSVLFVDIARFSTLASALVAQHGATQGAERLSALLERAYTELIAPVHGFGGNVIGFSGDAMTCWFADIDERAAQPAAQSGAVRALAAARLMRQALLALHIDTQAPASGLKNSERLAATFCIATGDVWRAEIGAPDFQRFSIVGGAPVTRVAVAESLAVQGQILLDAAAAREVGDLPGSAVLADFVVVDTSRDAVDSGLSPSGMIRYEPAADVALLDWIPHGARERLRQAPEFLASFKPVVAVFIQFGLGGMSSAGEGRTDLEAVTAATFVGRAQSVFESFGGRLVDVTVGEKGSYLFAAFGDLRVHEDDSRRALLAALKLRSESVSQRGEISVGIARGPAYAGLIGGAGRRTFGVIGLEVTLAARLMVAAASNEVLVAGPVSAAVGHEFEFSDERSATFKGFTLPVSVASLSGKREAARSRPVSRTELSSAPVLFGRDADIAELDAAVQRLLAGVGGIVELTGEPGIGKTALLRRAMARALAAGVTVQTGVGRALSAGAFSLWSDIVPSAGNQLDQVFEAGLSAAGRAARVTQELVATLSAMAASTPLVFALEDLHWADAESLSVLRQLVIAGPALLIVTTSRTEKFGLDQDLIPNSWEARQIGLKALSEPALRHLITTTFGVSNVARPILDFILGQADGSPLFAQELALALRDSGVVKVARDQAQLRDAATVLDASTSSETVQGIIAARMDELPAFEQILTKAASVIGREFAPATLEQVVLESIVYVEKSNSREAALASAAPQSVSLALESLVRREILQVVDDEGCYGFRHALAQQVAYGSLMHEHRARLHLRVALWLESSAPAEGAQLLQLAQLAHHWWQAAKGVESVSAADNALHYLERAGERALGLSAHTEALSCFKRALELVSNRRLQLAQDRVAHWHASAAIAEIGLGLFDDCAQSCNNALASLGYPLPQRPTLAVPLEVIRQVVRRLRGRGFRRPAGLLELSDPVSRRRLQQASEVLRLLSKSYFLNNALQTIYFNMLGMNLSERLGPGAEMALNYTTMQLTLGVIGSHSWAQAYGRESLAMAEQIEDFAARATLYLNCAVYRLSIGDWDQARAHASAAEILAVQRGDFGQLAETVAVRADVELLTGDVEASSKLYQQLFVEAERRGRWLEQAWSVRPEAQRALRAGQHDRARAMLEAHLGMLAPLNDSLIAIDVQGMRALAYARGAHGVDGGDDSPVRAAAAEALQLIERVSPPVSYPRYLGLAALVEALLLIDGGSGGKATKGGLVLSLQTRQAISALAAYAGVFPFALAARDLFKGWVAARQGKNRSAGKHLRRARKVAAEFGFAYEEARACAMLAVVSDKAQERAQCSELAASRFSELAIGTSALALENTLKNEWVGSA